MGHAHGNEAEPLRWQAVTERFADNAARTPERIAVECGDATVSYGEVARRVERMAARIAERLHDGERLVAVCIDRDVDLPAWLLAVLRVRGAYLPLDPSQPPVRIGHVLEDARPALIVANRRHAALVSASGVPLLIVEDADDAPPAPAPTFAIRPHDLAYVIYTSGSTGRPKGVEIEHGSLAALLATMAASPGFRAGQKMLGLTRISFDLSVPDMFLPFFVGGTLALVGLDVAGDPERLAEALRRHAPDLAQGTPSTWRALIEAGWRGQPGMRLLAGGEAMTRDLADRLLPCCAEVWNIYGPTETTVWSTACRVEDGSGPVPIGWPMDGYTVHVAGPALELLPWGETGEIVIGGSGVARGYRHRPDLTAERFVHLADGTRVYRTGDLGRFSADGRLFCLGRLDDQVKVRGFRIELGDVEAALAADPAVAWCAARLWNDPSGEAALVGYIVPRPGATPRGPEIKAALATLVPAYMVPDRIVIVAVMPLTPNGKVDRAALPSPFVGAGADVSDVPDTVAAQLAAIWCELLGVARVDASDDFFELGGYSLMTVRLARRIHAAFGIKLALVDVMRWSTLAAMADRIRGGGDAGGGAALLNGSGDRAALYWLDAGPLMRTMARALPADQPVIALNVAYEDEARFGERDVTIEAVATHLRGALLALQPRGPYLLGGWCRWGIVAFELARQLRSVGHEVDLLVLLDADHPYRPPARRLRDALARLTRRPAAPAEAPSFSQRVEQATHGYRPGRYDGDVLLVRPAALGGRGGWRNLSDAQLSIALTTGDHETMVRAPIVHEVADAIARRIAALEPETTVSPERRSEQRSS